MEKTNVEGLYAFWKYDIFPYCLGGEVAYINEDGSAYIPTYQGSVKPFLILPLKAGRELAAKLRKLENDRKSAMQVLSSEYEKKLKELINFKQII